MSRIRALSAPPAYRNGSTVPVVMRDAAIELLAPSARSPRGAVLISALPAEVNLELYRGDTFGLTVTVTDAAGDPYPLTGVTVAAQIRETADAEDIAATFVPTVTGSQIALNLTAVAAAGLPARGVWDLQLTGTGSVFVITLAGGTVTTAPDVTRP